MEQRHQIQIRIGITALKDLDTTLAVLQSSDDTDMVIQMAGLKMLRICVDFMVTNLKLLLKL